MSKVTTINTSKVGFIVVPLAVLLLLSLTSLVGAATFAPLSSQLDFGATGNEVIKLQTFLASNQDFYPAGTISGYYGNLTRNAVMQFQLYYGIPMVGRVGPMTLVKMNEVMAAGYGIDVYAPKIYNTSVQKTSTSATVTWATTESARGKVFYGTSPFTLNEAIGIFAEPTILGGTSTLAANMQLNQSVVLQNLSPNTHYYYVIEAIDASGNVSITQQSTFTTNP